MESEEIKKPVTIIFPLCENAHYERHSMDPCVSTQLESQILRMWRQEDHEFEISLGYTGSDYFLKYIHTNNKIHRF